jgi:hypothetical protein
VIKQRDRIILIGQIKPRRIVVSMTTSPKRINEIFKVIENLEHQTIRPDLYFINLPRFFKRDGSRFSEIPVSLINDKIIINICDDIGPATKIIPTCKHKDIKDTDIIFSVDDDIFYPPEILEIFLKAHILYPDCVITGTTLFPKKNPKRYGELIDCELLEGFSCVLYKKAWLVDIPTDMFNKKLVPIYHYLSDDLVLSNYLIMKGIKILSFTNRHSVIKRIKPLDYGLRDDALRKGANGLASTCTENQDCNHSNYIETILSYLEDDVKKL